MKLFQSPLRPPAALDEDSFLRLCVRCGKCVEICPHDTLFIEQSFGRGRHAPRFDPMRAPCQLCMKCPPACPTGALDSAITEMKDARIGRAYISTKLCHNFIDATMCMTCYDRCPLRGHAVILVNGLTPAITEDCAGCGVCAYVCPQKAIEIVPISSSRIPPNSARTEKSRG